MHSDVCLSSHTGPNIGGYGHALHFFFKVSSQLTFLIICLEFVIYVTFLNSSNWLKVPNNLTIQIGFKFCTIIWLTLSVIFLA